MTSREFSAIRSANAVFSEASNDSVFANSETEGSGLFVSPDPGSADVTGYVLTASTAEGKAKWSKTVIDAALGDLTDVDTAGAVANDVLMFDGTEWKAGEADTGGIASLNGLTSVSQSMVTGSAGTDFSIVSAGSTHTFNIPDAGPAARGLLTSSEFAFFDDKLDGTLPSANIFVGNGFDVASAVPVTGDVTLANDGTVALVSSGVTPGSYGSVTNIPQLTIDSKGLVTAATNIVIPATSFAVTSVASPDAALSGSPFIPGGNVVLNIPDASATQRGALTSSDWTMFDNKLSNTLPAGQVFVGSASNEATAQTISGDATIDPTGTLSLSATGVVPGTYGAGGTRVAQLLISTEGRIDTATNIDIPPISLSVTADDAPDIAVSGSPASPGDALILNVPDATATQRGALTSSDWSAFNSKVPGTLGDSQIFVGDASSMPVAVTMSGDMTVSNTGVTALSNTGVAAGNYTNATITVDARGRVTSASSNSGPAGPEGSVQYNNGGVLAGSSRLIFDDIGGILKVDGKISSIPANDLVVTTENSATTAGSLIVSAGSGPTPGDVILRPGTGSGGGSGGDLKLITTETTFIFPPTATAADVGKTFTVDSVGASGVVLAFKDLAINAPDKAVLFNNAGEIAGTGAITLDGDTLVCPNITTPPGSALKISTPTAATGTPSMPIEIKAGDSNSTGSSAGGNVLLEAGDASVAGTGGMAFVYAGDSTVGQGGDLIARGGSSAGGAGGVMTLFGASGTTTGSVHIQGGDAAAGLIAGGIKIVSGFSGTGKCGDISLEASSNATPGSEGDLYIQVKSIKCKWPTNTVAPPVGSLLYAESVSGPNVDLGFITPAVRDYYYGFVGAPLTVTTPGVIDLFIEGPSSGITQTLEDIVLITNKVYLFTMTIVADSITPNIGRIQLEILDKNGGSPVPTVLDVFMTTFITPAISANSVLNAVVETVTRTGNDLIMNVSVKAFLNGAMSADLSAESSFIITEV